MAERDEKHTKPEDEKPLETVSDEDVEKVAGGAINLNRAVTMRPRGLGDGRPSDSPEPPTPPSGSIRIGS